MSYHSDSSTYTIDPKKIRKELKKLKDRKQQYPTVGDDSDFVVSDDYSRGQAQGEKKKPAAGQRRRRRHDRVMSSSDDELDSRKITAHREELSRPTRATAPARGALAESESEGHKNANESDWESSAAQAARAVAATPVDKPKEAMPSSPCAAAPGAATTAGQKRRRRRDKVRSSWDDGLDPKNIIEHGEGRSRLTRATAPARGALAEPESEGHKNANESDREKSAAQAAGTVIARQLPNPRKRFRQAPALRQP